MCSFPTEYLMQQHVKLVHLRKFDKICDVCGKSVRGREALVRHMKEHTGDPQQVIKCDLCDSTLTTKYGLARHIKMMHTAENLQPIQCEYCLKVSPSLQAHQHHIKYTHNTARTHQCPMCEKAFKRPNELRVSSLCHESVVQIKINNVYFYYYCRNTWQLILARCCIPARTAQRPSTRMQICMRTVRKCTLKNGRSIIISITHVVATQIQSSPWVCARQRREHPLE